jgi:hypothetical protein
MSLWGLRRDGSMAGMVVLCAFALAAPASAQTSLQIPLQFDFVNPGAKSLALGGAFVGLADDATATFANPAGLRQLPATEFSLELRGAWTGTTFLERGRLSGLVTNEGEDVVQGSRFGDLSNSRFGPGFMSVVYVPGSQSHWRLAGYRHALVRIDQSFQSQGVFQQDAVESQTTRELPQEGLREVSITAYGISGAVDVIKHPTEPGRDRLSIGATLGIYSMHLDSQFRRFHTLGGFTGPPDFSRVAGIGTQVGDDVAVAPTLGALWRADTWSFGGVYRHGPSLAYATTINDEPPTDSRFRVPDTLAFGAQTTRFLKDASGNPHTVLTIASEVTWVNYSRLREDFVTDQARSSQRIEDFTIDDGVEFHLGVEVTKPEMKFVPRFRGGFWFDPDHSVKFSPIVPSETPTDRLFDERFTTALSTGKNQFHVTGGVGLALHARLELNGGIDLSPTSRLYSVSVIVR